VQWSAERGEGGGGRYGVKRGRDGGEGGVRGRRKAVYRFVGGGPNGVTKGSGGCGRTEELTRGVGYGV